MNVLITGGAGFIGSHFAEKCLNQKWRVSVIDDLSTGSIANIYHLKANTAFSCRIGTVFDKELVADAVDEADLVVHLAAAVGVRLIVESPVRTIETNIHGTEVVLAAAAKKRKPVILASTSEVYGKSQNIPFSESADLVMGSPTIARWSYACSKALDECLGLAYWREYRVPVTVVRFFNTVGPRQTGRYGMVLPTFVSQALARQRITVFGTGNQKRCFSYVDDVVEALARLAISDRAFGEIVNIGNDREISINELAGLVKQVARSESEIVHIPYEECYGPGFEDMFRRVPSLEKLQRLTGYRPTTSIESIVESVVRYQVKVEQAAA
jgi:UDP-glucose 4-epimerase